MSLEFVTAGFPLIHNAPDWSDMGYYYHGHNLELAEAALKAAIMQHDTNLEAYKCGAECVKWRHSPYNPELQAAWKSLLG